MLKLPVSKTAVSIVTVCLFLSGTVTGAVQVMHMNRYTHQQAVLAAQNERMQGYFTRLRSLTPSPSPTPTPTPTISLKYLLASPSAAASQAATPTPGVSTLQTTSPFNGGKLFGVNISGAEFGDHSLPGNVNADYIYPTNGGEFSYFHSHGLTLVRIPFRWERVQHQAYGDLNQPDIDSLKSVVSAAGANGEKVILDLHNYGRYYDAPLTAGDSGKLADVWKKLAGQFANDPNIYGYELMNEPHDMPDGSGGWNTIAQASTDAIRQVDTTHYVIVPGYDWQSAARWEQSNNSLLVKDNTGKIIYSAHEYFDHDQSGTYKSSYDGEGANPDTGKNLVQPFLDWLKNNNRQGILTEYGIPDNDSRWNTVLNNFLQALAGSPNIVGGTYWAGGPWWGSYPLSVEPNNGADRPQMSVLQQFQSH